eukprot:gene17926-23548_t
MSRIASLNDINKKDDKKKNEYYAGGVDNRGGGSGLAVEGPPRPNGPNDPYDEIVRRATENSRDPNISSTIDDSNRRRITLYRNGFTIDDGPLRDALTPEGIAFLQDLQNGRLPTELNNGKELTVELADKRQEEYKAPPAPAYIPYSGTGASLGSSQSDDACIFTPDILEDVEEIIVNNNRPSTTVQIKTHNGQKLKLKINHDSTVLQLAAHINRVVPTDAFTLNAGFPPKDIVDPTQTMKEANLIGASITQKTI